MQAATSHVQRGEESEAMRKMRMVKKKKKG
jgi:hypothetical protein